MLMAVKYALAFKLLLVSLVIKVKIKQIQL